MEPYGEGPPGGCQRPWASPGPQGNAPGPQGYAPIPPAPVLWRPPPPPPPQPKRHSARRRVALVVGIVLGSVALLGATVAGALTVGEAVSGFVGEDPVGIGSGGEYEPLTGKLSNPPATPLPAADLEMSVHQVLVNDFYDVQSLTCPQVPKVDQGVVSVCHGELDDEKYAVIVFFEDKAGRYTLLLN